MFGDIIVPLDGSDESARALGPASAIARYLNRTMHIVTYYGHGNDLDALQQAVHRQARAIGDVKRTCEFLPAEGPVVNGLVKLLSEMPSALLVMASHGRGRSAALVGSVANDILHRSAGPILLVGPYCQESRFRLHGPLVVATDSTDHGDAIVPIVEAFASVFDFEPEVVTVHDPKNATVYESHRAGLSGTDLPPESASVHNTALAVEAAIGTEVNYQVLHDAHPAKALVRHAKENHAALIAMATHAEEGLARLSHGSVTAATVAGAPCPVLVYRPLVLN